MLILTPGSNFVIFLARLVILLARLVILLVHLVILLVHLVILLVRSVAPSSTPVRWYYITSFLTLWLGLR